MKKKEMYAVLLAGGTGERLWPLSRLHHPKQFLSLTGKKTMFEDSLDRAKKINPNIKIWCVASEKYKQKIRKYGGKDLQKCLYEPVPRNTAPAVLYACLKIAQENPDALIAFFPTDHYIPETKKFATIISRALIHADRSNTITLLGIEPGYPATGYGYIRVENKFVKEYPCKALGFFEKPSKKQAIEFFDAGNMLWNAGIFCGPVACFIEAFKIHSPKLFTAAQDFLSGTTDYRALPDISFDYAILEKLENVSVIPVDFRWSDVGDIATFLSFKDRARKGIVSINARNNIVHSNKKIVALADVDNLCIVETSDAILILPKDKAQEVKNVLKLIKKEKDLKSML